jgi:hypothetical protein
MIGLLKLMLAINTKTTIMKLSSKEPEQYSLILHIRHYEHYEHQKPIQQIS